MHADELKKEIAKIKYWHHRIDLGNGVTTPGAGDTAAVLSRLGMPDD